VLTFFKTEIQILKDKGIEMPDTYILKGNEQISQIGFFMSTCNIGKRLQGIV
jgi:hypothetical protein